MASRSFGSPRDIEYRWFAGFVAASASFCTAMSGDGMSGLPKPRSMTSRPARRASIFRLLMIVKTYGGRFSIRLNSMQRTLPVTLCQHGRRIRRANGEGAAARLHLRGHRDPTGQPEQVRD